MINPCVYQCFLTLWKTRLYKKSLCVPYTVDDPVMYEDYAERDRVKFKATADEDGDGKLSKTEFAFFMYPEQHQFMARHVVGVSIIVITGYEITGLMGCADC